MLTLVFELVAHVSMLPLHLPLPLPQRRFLRHPISRSA
jgi:hypothetical protein